MPASGSRQEALIATLIVESLFPSTQGQQIPPADKLQAPQVGDRRLHPPGTMDEGSYSGIPVGPPPGLIRVGPTLPAIPRLVTDQDVSLFGDFAQCLDTGADENGEYVKLDLTCTICLTSKLEVPEYVRAHDRSDSEEVEGLTVLPCGHFFGSWCLEKWLRRVDRRENYPHCPLCRFELVYRCGHYLPPRVYDTSEKRKQQIPLTLPEHGAIPARCGMCFELEIENAVDTFCTLLFPPHVPEGDLMFSQSRELLEEASIQFRGTIESLYTMRDLYVHW